MPSCRMAFLGKDGISKHKEEKAMVYQYLVMKKKCLMEALELLDGKLPELLEPWEMEVAWMLIRDAAEYHGRCYGRKGGCLPVADTDGALGSALPRMEA